MVGNAAWLHSFNKTAATLIVPKRCRFIVLLNHELRKSLPIVFISDGFCHFIFTGHLEIGINIQEFLMRLFGASKG